jgi:hypothetical protein
MRITQSVRCANTKLLLDSRDSPSETDGPQGLRVIARGKGPERPELSFASSKISRSTLVAGTPAAERFPRDAVVDLLPGSQLRKLPNQSTPSWTSICRVRTLNSQR